MTPIFEPAMTVGHFKIDQLIAIIKEFISEILMFDIENGTISSIEELIEKLNPNLNCYFEYPYVDKVYRDSYYSYYATKLSSTHKNCARISFFSEDIKEDYFRTPDKFETIEKNYYGFIIIRPTQINVLGRNILSPKAFIQDIGVLCLTKFQAQIDGVRLDVRAFPHSSQDTETLSCAETTILSVMEYFGNRYPEYSPVLPSSIHKVLATQTYERQLPSHGLSPEQISFALKSFGFGTKIYSLAKKIYDDDAYQRDDLRQLLGHYVESGIPVIAAVENENLAHALVIIGHQRIDLTKMKLDSLPFIKTHNGSRSFIIYDYSDFIKEFISIDDNLAPYSNFTFDNPTVSYTDPNFKDCELVTIVVPLYHKIYLEAPEAKQFLIAYLEEWYLPKGEDVIILRLFCTSSRTLKAELNKRVFIGAEANEIILNTSMPRFVWVGEITTPALLRDGKACGLVILDAMETVSELSRICFVQKDKVITYSHHHEPNATGFFKFDVDTNNFCIFANNLQQY